MQTSLNSLCKYLQNREAPEKTLVLVPITRAKHLIEHRLSLNVLPEIETLSSFVRKYSEKRESDETELLALTEKLVAKFFPQYQTPFFSEMLLAETREVLLNLPEDRKLDELKILLSLTGFMEDDEARKLLAEKLGIYEKKARKLGSDFVAFVREFTGELNRRKLYLYETELHEFLKNTGKLKNLLKSFNEIIFYDFSYVFPTEKRFFKEIIAFAEKRNIPVNFFSSVPSENLFKDTLFFSNKKIFVTKKKNPRALTIYLSEKNARIKWLATELEKISPEKKILLLLTDGNYLFEVLNCIPEKFSKVNPSIALKYSFFKITHLLRFISDFFASPDKEESLFYLRLADLLFPEKAVINAFEKLPTYEELQTELQSEFFNLLVNHLRTFSQKKSFYEFWKKLFLLFQEESERENSLIFNKLEKKVLKKVFYNYERFAMFFPAESARKENLLLRFFIYWLEKQKIFFTGRSWEGLQILTLNGTVGEHYDYVFLLFADYDELPKKTSQKHLILPQIKNRLGFLTANHLAKKEYYALLSVFYHCNNIVFLAKSKEEESHFLKMLRTFVAPFGSENLKLPEPEIEKNSIIMLSEKHLENLKTQIKEKGISYSLLRSYFQSPEQFLLENFVEIPLEQENPVLYFTEEISLKNVGEIVKYNELGEMFHRILAKVFSEKNPEERLSQIVNEQIKKYIPKKEFHSVYREIAMKVVENVLEKHKQEKYPIQGLEITLNWQFDNEFFLTGTLDRIDFKDGNLRIIDYKTGKEKKLSKNINPEIALQRVFEKEGKPQEADVLQLIIYAVLVSENLEKLGLSEKQVEKYELIFWNLGTNNQAKLGFSRKQIREIKEILREKLLRFVENLLTEREFVV